MGTCGRPLGGAAVVRRRAGGDVRRLRVPIARRHADRRATGGRSMLADAGTTLDNVLPSARGLVARHAEPTSDRRHETYAGWAFDAPADTTISCLRALSVRSDLRAARLPAARDAGSSTTLRSSTLATPRYAQSAVRRVDGLPRVGRPERRRWPRSNREARAGVADPASHLRDHAATRRRHCPPAGARRTSRSASSRSRSWTRDATRRRSRSPARRRCCRRPGRSTVSASVVVSRRGPRRRNRHRSRSSSTA